MEDKPVINPLETIAQQLSHDLVLKLASKANSVQNKYDYYNADNDVRDLGISSPRRMVNNRPGIGWASRAVNTLADRVEFDAFANDKWGINQYLEEIGGFSVIKKAKNDALVAGCAFILVANDPTTGRKVIVPFTALEATGEVDQNTGLLKYGMAVTRWGKLKPAKKGVLFAPQDYIIFTPQFSAVYKNQALDEIYPNETGRTLLHPITHRSSADRPLGKSRITNTVRRIINEVSRLKRREEIAEEFYSMPQRYITGLADGATKDPALDSAIGKVWAITKDEDGDSPKIDQLQQMSIDGFVGAKKDKARDFCAETGLTLRNLGYETGNPTSAESLSAMSDDLLLEARNSQEEIGEQLKQMAITLRMAIDGTNVVPDPLKALQPAWKPIFQPDTAALGDSVYKLQQAMPELIGTVAGYRLLGVGIREAEELAAIRQSNAAKNFMVNEGVQ